MSQMQHGGQSYPPRLGQAYADWLNSKFKDDDYALTLTFRPHLSGNQANRAEDVRQFHRLVNNKLLGRNYTLPLEFVYVFEWDASKTALHVHGILENRSDCSIAPRAQMAPIMDCWMKLKCSGVRKANEITFAWEKDDHWIGYMMKNVNKYHSEFADVSAWTLNN